MTTANVAEAIAARRALMAGPDREKAALAAFELGAYYQQQPDGAAEAAACFQAAAQSPQVKVATAALLNLAGLAAQRGDLSAAEKEYGRVLAFGDPETLVMAAYGLGTVLSRRPGREQEAETAYRQAAGSGDAEYGPMAAYDLGVYLSAQPGRLQDACDALRQAAGSGHAEYGPASLFNLGVLLAQAGCPEEAERAYRRAIETGHRDIAPRAAVNLGGLLENVADRRADAEQAYAYAMQSGHLEQGPMAAANLGNLLAAQPHRRADAETAYRAAMASGHPLHAPRAAYNLGVALLGDPSRRDDAAAAWRAAADSGEPQHAPLALYNLGRLLAEDRACADEARAVLERAAGSGHAAVVTAAGQLLAELAAAEAEDILGLALGAGWHCATAGTEGRFHLQEYLPDGQTSGDWREIVTIKRIEAGNELTTETYLGALRRGIEARLIDGTLRWEILSVSDQELIYESAIEGDVAAVNQSELVRVLRTPSALHTVQHAVRGETVRLGFDRATRLALLQSSRLERRRPPAVAAPRGLDPDGPAAVIRAIAGRPAGDRSGRIDLCREGLRRLGKGEDPERWSQLQLLLGLSLLEGPPGDPPEDAEALTALRRALEVFTLEQSPSEWARALRGVGRVHLARARSRAGVDRAASQAEVRRAVAAFDKARLGHPPGSVDWAAVMLDLAEAQLSVDLRAASATYSALLAAVENMPAVAPGGASELDAQAITEIVIRATAGLQRIDALEFGEPIVPEGLRERPKRGKVLYLRPLVSAGTLKLRNQRVPSAFPVQFAREPETLTIETLLYLVFGPDFNFLALGGRPEGYGGSRFIMARGGTEWQQTLRLLAEDARFIVVVPHQSAGVSWEMNFLIETGRIERTLFVMPPLSLDTDVEAMWRGAAQMMAGHGLRLPPYRPEGLVFRLAPQQAVLEEWPFATLWENRLTAGCP